MISATGWSIGKYGQPRSFSFQSELEIGRIGRRRPLLTLLNKTALQMILSTSTKLNSWAVQCSSHGPMRWTAAFALGVWRQPWHPCERSSPARCSFCWRKQPEVSLWRSIQGSVLHCVRHFRNNYAWCQWPRPSVPEIGNLMSMVVWSSDRRLSIWYWLWKFQLLAYISRRMQVLEGIAKNT